MLFYKHLYLSDHDLWKDYQAVIYSNYPDEYALSDRDAWMVTFAEMGKTYSWIQERLELTIRVNSIGERIRRGVSGRLNLPRRSSER